MVFCCLLFHFMLWTLLISFKSASPAEFIMDSTPSQLLLVIFNSCNSNPQLTEQCLSFCWTFNFIFRVFFSLFLIMLWFILQVFIYNVLGTKHSYFRYPRENKWTKATSALKVLTVLLVFVARHCMYLPLFVGVTVPCAFSYTCLSSPTLISFALLDSSFVVWGLSLSERQAVESACLWD